MSVKKALTRSVLVLASIVLILIVALLLRSPGTTPAHLSDDGSTTPYGIAEVRNVSINGTHQRLLVRGTDRRNPVLLHLHGGPGGADQVILQGFGKTLEDLFTVVYWDQRGSGASYNPDMKGKPLTLEQIVDDGVTISEMLIKEFGQERIYLQGHSWGTLLGVNMVTKAPEHFKAFFAVGLFADSQSSEKLSWEYALNSARDAGDTGTVTRLEQIGPPPYQTDEQWIQSVTEQRQLLWPYENPDAKPLFTMSSIYWDFAIYKGYTLAEKLNALGGLDYSMKNLWPTVVATNLIETHTRLEVPFYVFQGKYDQHTVTEIAKRYFDAVIAPEKKYHLFEHSAHWPHIREYERYRKLILIHLREIEEGGAR